MTRSIRLLSWLFIGSLLNALAPVDPPSSYTASSSSSSGFSLLIRPCPWILPRQQLHSTKAQADIHFHIFQTRIDGKDLSKENCTCMPIPTYATSSPSSIAVVYFVHHGADAPPTLKACFNISPVNFGKFFSDSFLGEHRPYSSNYSLYLRMHP